MRIEFVHVASLVEDPRNARRHPNENLAAITASLKAHGQQKPLVVDASGKVLAGNGTLRAARALGWEKIAVVRTKLEGAAAIAYAIADNQTALTAEWDLPNLKDLLQELDTGALDMAATGFSEADLEDMMTAATPEITDAEPQMTRADELAKKWGVERGQVWKLGEHRLMCGDSTSAEDVARVMGGKDAMALLTDPPYGQNQPGVPGDDPEGNEELVRRCLANLPPSIGIAIAFQSPRTFPIWLDAARVAGWKFERMLWLYTAAQGTYPWRGWLLKSEAILVCSRKNAVWNDFHPYAHDCYYKSEVSGELDPALGWHGSVKPADIVRDLMSRISAEGQIIFDPFLGSGTTLIAAEQLNRCAFGMEISPSYVGVALQRWADSTGKTPELIR